MNAFFFVNCTCKNDHRQNLFDNVAEIKALEFISFHFLNNTNKLLVIDVKYDDKNLSGIKSSKL